MAPSFLVLPFANRSGEADQDYVAVNLTGDLTTGLSAIHDSVVIAASSARTIATRNPNPTLAQLEHDFAIHYVLRGSVSREGPRFHIATVLIRAESGEELWKEEFDCDLAALRPLEWDIVARIAQRLGTSVVPPKPPPTPLPLQDIAALESVMRAKVLADGPTTLQTLAEQQRLFSAAFASAALASEAKAGLAAVHLALALAAGGGAAGSDLAESERLLQEALANDPLNGRALSTLGALRRATGKPREALSAYESAVAVDRNDANAHAQSGRLMIDLGEAQQAIAHIELALRLSPLDPQRSLWYTFAGLALLHLGDPGGAQKWLEKATADAPGFVTAFVFLAAAQELGRQEVEARRTIVAVRRMNPALTVARVEQQFAPVDRGSKRWSEIRGALRQAGLPN